jgi:hypothetical protein
VEPGGSKRSGYSVTGWKGEAPDMTRHTFNLVKAGHEVTPLYRRADGQGWEHMDGTPEH